MRKKLISGLIIFISLYLIVSLSREILELIRKEEVIEKEQLKLEELKVENQILSEKLEYFQSEEFVEKEAREKLGLAKEGETIVILPEGFENIMESNQPEEKIAETPNWQQWLKLFGF